VVDRVALGQVFLRVLWFSPVSLIPPWLSMLIYHLEDGCISERQSHVIDMNSNMRSEFMVQAV